MTELMISELLEKTWPGWELVQRIGGGAYGQVYEIRKTDFGESFSAALKVICVPNDQEAGSANSLMSDVDASVYYESVAEALMREYSIMAKLKGNSNIVSYEDHTRLLREDGIGWVILIRMELLKPIHTHILEHGITRQGVIRLGIDICRALELCQKYRILHRDIKPDNIFVTEFGDHKLGDFGVARTLEDTKAVLSKQGTSMYMAPEVYAGHTYNVTADLYSLGLVMYQYMNLNRAPLIAEPYTYTAQMEALSRRMSGEPLPFPSQESGELARVVLRACSPEAGERYAQPQEMRAALEALLDAGDERFFLLPGLQAPPPVVEPEPEKPEIPEPEHKEPEATPPKRGKWIALAAAGLAVVILAVALLGGGRDTPPAATPGPVVPTPESGKPAAALDWSDWVTELPAGLSVETHAIETRQEYRCAPLHAFGSDEDAGDEYELCYTVLGDYGEWSEWQSEEIEENSLVEVEEKTSYRYRRMYTQTVTDLYHTVTTTSYYWSDWMTSDTPVGGNGVEIQEIRQYRSREREALRCCSLEKEWGLFSDTVLYPDETQIVEVRTLYRYAERTSPETQTGSMENFPAPSGGYAGRFADVDDDAWYGGNRSDAIGAMVELGIIPTDRYTCFRPREHMTLAELIRAAAVLHNIYHGGTGRFPEGEPWYQVYVDYAMEQGLLEAGEYADLTAAATRQDVAYILWHALPQTEMLGINVVSSITDMDISSKYYKSTYQMAQAGIIAWPEPAYTFKPEEPVTRAEAASFLYRMAYPEHRVVS